MLESHIPHCGGGLHNQQGSKDFDPEKPQKISLDWEYERDPNLPCDCYTYSLECTINPSVPVLSHLLSLKISTTDPDCDLMTETEYLLSIRQLISLLPFLKADRFDEVCGLLVAEDLEEYELSGLQKALGMPKPFRHSDN